MPFNRHTDPNESIRLTDVDAAGARLSAQKLHYVEDQFITHLVPRAHTQPIRPPLINHGTYVRSASIDELVFQWLELSNKSGKPCQIVSLGAGSDSRFWRLATSPYKRYLSRYVELDFPAVTSKKAMAIRKSKALGALLGDSDHTTLCYGGTGIHATVYHLLPVDLRLPPAQTLAPLLSSPGSSGILESSEPLLSPSLPTLLLFECVLVYMSPAESSALLQWFVDYFAASDSHLDGSVLGGIVYEMFGLQDAFGQVMLKNLQLRNISLPGAEPYPTIGSLPKRFTQHGFDIVRAITLRNIRRNHIGDTERERISKLELLDEIEELEMVLEHYAITWGIKFSGHGVREVWNDWGFNGELRTGC